MSFGAPFLFDWRLFCERGLSSNSISFLKFRIWKINFALGQPRYVHKHEGDGLRVDECEARFLNKVKVFH